MMNKLFKWVSACFAAAIAFALPLVAQAVVFTGDYAAWSGVSGAVAWRGDGGNFEVSKVADIDTDGNIGEPYPMAWNQAASTTSHRFCSSQAEYTSPGMLLVYDQSGCSADANATFSPLSFGGLWVKALSSESTPRRRQNPYSDRCQKHQKQNMESTRWKAPSPRDRRTKAG